MVPVNKQPLNNLASEILEINKANGWEVATPAAWDDTRHIPTQLCLIHSEVSEALEGFRKGDKENVAEELADVLIRVLDLAGGLGVDMDLEVTTKLAKNRQRGYKHGGKRI
jgi:NTP pyrophosphatase (non-canonical NTP hydrolase)